MLKAVGCRQAGTENIWEAAAFQMGGSGCVASTTLRPATRPGNNMGAVGQVLVQPALLLLLPLRQQLPRAGGYSHHVQRITIMVYGWVQATTSCEGHRL